MRQLATSRTATGALLALTAALMLCAVEYTFHLSSGLTDVLNNWVYNNVMLAAGAACVARGILRERDRVAWFLMGASFCSWGFGDTIWTFTVVFFLNETATTVIYTRFLGDDSGAGS